MMIRSRLYTVMLLASLVITFIFVIPSIAVAQDATLYKLLKTLSNNNQLRCGPGESAPRMEATVPANKWLVEIRRVDRHWVQIAKPDSLKDFLRSIGAGGQRLECEDEDWYFYDYHPDRPPSNFDSEPYYNLAAWFASGEVRGDEIVLTRQSEIDNSVVRSLQTDLNEERVGPFAIDVLVGDTPLRSGIEPILSINPAMLQVPIQGLASELPTEDSLLTIRWKKNQGFLGESEYTIKNPDYRPPIIEPPIDPRPLGDTSTSETSVSGALWYVAVFLGGLLIGWGLWNFNYRRVAQANALIHTLDTIDTKLGIAPHRPTLEAIDAHMVLGRKSEREKRLREVEHMRTHLADLDVIIAELEDERPGPQHGMEREQWLFSEEASLKRRSVVNLVRLLPHIKVLLEDLEQYDKYFGLSLSDTEDMETWLTQALTNQQKRKAVLKNHEEVIRLLEQAVYQLDQVDRMLEIDTNAGMMPTSERLSASDTKRVVGNKRAKSRKEELEFYLAENAKSNAKGVSHQVSAQDDTRPLLEAVVETEERLSEKISRLHEILERQTQALEQANRPYPGHAVMSPSREHSPDSQALDLNPGIEPTDSLSEDVSAAESASTSQSGFVMTIPRQQRRVASRSQLLGTVQAKARTLYENAPAGTRAYDFGHKATEALEDLQYDDTRNGPEAQMACEIAQVLAPLWEPPDDRKVFVQVLQDDQWNLVVGTETMEEVVVEDLSAEEHAKVEAYIQEYGRGSAGGVVVLEPGIEWVGEASRLKAHVGKCYRWSM